MVNAPVETTFATELPDTVPKSALEITATFAGPPRLEPARDMARSMKNGPAPEKVKNAPNTMNRKTMVAEAFIGEPKTAS